MTYLHYAEDYDNYIENAGRYCQLHISIYHGLQANLSLPPIVLLLEGYSGTYNCHHCGEVCGFV